MIYFVFICDYTCKFTSVIRKTGQKGEDMRCVTAYKQNDFAVFAF